MRIRTSSKRQVTWVICPAIRALLRLFLRPDERMIHTHTYERAADRNLSATRYPRPALLPSPAKRHYHAGGPFSLLRLTDL